MSLARTAFRSVTAGPSNLRYVPRPILNSGLSLRPVPLQTLSPRIYLGSGISNRFNSSQAGKSDPAEDVDVDSLRLEAPTPGSKSQPIGRIEPRLYVPLIL